MISDDDLRRYLGDRHAFRREQIRLPNGKLLGEVEEGWQTRHVFGPLDERHGGGWTLRDGKWDYRRDSGWRYRLLYFELHRGAAKSATLAAEALTTAVLEEDVRVYFLSGDRDQAGIARDMLEGYIRRNPDLESSFRITRDEIVVPATGTVIRVMSSDAPTAYGLGGLSRRFLALCDELWVWQGRELWDAIFTAAPKSEDWRIIVASNAGFDTTSAAWQIRELCRERADERFYLYAPPGIIAGWIKPEDVEAQRKSLPPQVFQRLWQNRWTEGSGSFITREQLNACLDSTWGPQSAGVDGVRYFAALDLGLVRDRTARAVVHFDRDTGKVVLDSLRVWAGSRDKPVVIEEVEEDLLAVKERFRDPVFYLDPWQLQSTLQRLRGKLRLEPFTFTAESVRRLSENLYQLLRNGKLRLYPDGALEAELLRLEMVETTYGWRIDHRSGGFSDMAVAVGMAALGAVVEGARGSLLDPFDESGGLTREELEDLRGAKKGAVMAGVRGREF